MIIDYLHYKLNSSFEELKEELIPINKKYTTSRNCYKSVKYSDITFYENKLNTKIYLSFNEGKLSEVHYLFLSKELDYIKSVVNSFASNEKEKLCQGWLYEEMHLESFTPNYTATIEIINKKYIVLSVSNPLLDEEE